MTISRKTKTARAPAKKVCNEIESPRTNIYEDSRSANWSECPKGPVRLSKAGGPVFLVLSSIEGGPSFRAFVFCERVGCDDASLSFFSALRLRLRAGLRQSGMYFLFFLSRHFMPGYFHTPLTGLNNSKQHDTLKSVILSGAHRKGYAPMD